MLTQPKRKEPAGMDMTNESEEKKLVKTKPCVVVLKPLDRNLMESAHNDWVSQYAKNFP